MRIPLQKLLPFTLLYAPRPLSKNVKNPGIHLKNHGFLLHPKTCPCNQPVSVFFTQPQNQAYLYVFANEYVHHTYRTSAGTCRRILQIFTFNDLIIVTKNSGSLFC
jgi:hypothetical protein